MRGSVLAAAEILVFCAAVSIVSTVERTGLRRHRPACAMCFLDLFRHCGHKDGSTVLVVNESLAGSCLRVQYLLNRNSAASAVGLRSIGATLL